ncbi:MAG: hypothetical protein WA126_13345 [Thermodesulfovibrionales bacterium]
MTFKKHTSDEMLELFNKKPFQGQVPEKASIIFLSSDANYSPEISKHPFFKYILEYQKDGISFWNKYGCHHPFMLSDYPFNRNEAGVPFHRNFSKLGLRPTEKYAEHISFLEILDVPTIGNKSQNKKQFFKMVSLKHQRYIDKLIKDSSRKLFFVSNGVLRDIVRIKKTHLDNDLFVWADFAAGSKNQFTKIINGNKIKEIYHFSSTKIHSQLAEIKSEINQWLGYN